MTGGLVERGGVKGKNDGCRSVICTFTRILTRTHTHIRTRIRTRLHTRIRTRIRIPSYVSVRHPFAKRFSGVKNDQGFSRKSGGKRYGCRSVI